MKKILLAIAATSLFSSCSVMMASKVDGVEFESIQNVHTRTQLIALGGEPVTSDKNDNGELVETYKILEQRGSVARAFMHGLLDIGTGFLWEFAGTPIESALMQEKSFTVKVTFDQEDQIKKIELF